MAITNTWSVSDMQHMDSDGGVFLVYWSMVAANVTGQDSEGNDITDYTATEAGKLRCEYDASAAGYIAYADLTEANVLGWVWTSLIKDGETATEAKTRIEADRTAKVQKQIEAASATLNGVPW